MNSTFQGAGYDIYSTLKNGSRRTTLPSSIAWVAGTAAAGYFVGKAVSGKSGGVLGAIIGLGVHALTAARMLKQEAEEQKRIQSFQPGPRPVVNAPQPILPPVNPVPQKQQTYPVYPTPEQKAEPSTVTKPTVISTHKAGSDPLDMRYVLMEIPDASGGSHKEQHEGYKVGDGVLEYSWHTVTDPEELKKECNAHNVYGATSYHWDDANKICTIEEPLRTIKMELNKTKFQDHTIFESLPQLEAYCTENKKWWWFPEHELCVIPGMRV